MIKRNFILEALFFVTCVSSTRCGQSGTSGMSGPGADAAPGWAAQSLEDALPAPVFLRFTSASFALGAALCLTPGLGDAAGAALAAEAAAARAHTLPLMVHATTLCLSLTSYLLFSSKAARQASLLMFVSGVASATHALLAFAPVAASVSAFGTLTTPLRTVAWMHSTPTSALFTGCRHNAWSPLTARVRSAPPHLRAGRRLARRRRQAGGAAGGVPGHRAGGGDGDARRARVPVDVPLLYFLRAAHQSHDRHVRRGDGEKRARVAARARGACVPHVRAHPLVRLPGALPRRRHGAPPARARRDGVGRGGRGDQVAVCRHAAARKHRDPRRGRPGGGQGRHRGQGAAGGVAVPRDQEPAERVRHVSPSLCSFFFVGSDFLPPPFFPSPPGWPAASCAA